MRFLTSCFLHGSVSLNPLFKPLGPFQIFSKIHGDIRSSMCTTGVVDSGGKWKKSSIRKVFIISFGHFWVVELAYKYVFPFFPFVTSINNTSETGGKICRPCR
jgi:hypothetical protein